MLRDSRPCAAHGLLRSPVPPRSYRAHGKRFLELYAPAVARVVYLRSFEQAQVLIDPKRPRNWLYLANVTMPFVHSGAKPTQHLIQISRQHQFMGFLSDHCVMIPGHRNDLQASGE
jgi:hypothetical protein